MDVTIGEEAIDANIIDNSGDCRDRGRQNVRRNFCHDKYDSRDRNRSRTGERSLTPRRNDGRHNSPNANLED